MSKHPKAAKVEEFAEQHETEIVFRGERVGRVSRGKDAGFHGD